MKVTDTASLNPEGAPEGLRCQYWKFHVSPGWMEAPPEDGIPKPGPPEAELEMSVVKVPAAEIAPRSKR